MWQNNRSPLYTIRTANTALLVLLILYLSLDIISVLLMLLTGSAPDTETLLVLQALCGVPVIVISLVSAQPKTALGLRVTSFKNVILTLLLAFFSYIAIKVIINLVAYAMLQNGIELPDSLVNNPIMKMPFLVQLFMLCVVAPFTEEILFRGMIQNAYERKYGVRALVFAGLLFGWMHGEPISILNGAMAGLLMGYVYYKTRSIWMPILFHMCFNLFAFTFIPDSFVINLPWVLRLFPIETAGFDNLYYTIYNLGILAIGLLMIFVLMKLLHLHNKPTISYKANVYMPEHGATPMFIVILTLMAIRTVPSILMYAMSSLQLL